MALVAFQESEQGKKNETSTNASNASHVEIEEYESPHMLIFGVNYWSKLWWRQEEQLESRFKGGWDG